MEEGIDGSTNSDDENEMKTKKIILGILLIGSQECSFEHGIVLNKE